MLNRRAFVVSLFVPLVAPAAGRPGRAFAQKAPAAPPLPPVAWTCPMHAEVVESAAGACPICGMTLVAVRLALVWTCRVHTDISEMEPGRCRRCGRDLVRVTKAMTFTCPVHRKVDQIDPGRCPLCKRTLIAKYTIRPHGDHNAKHGGYFMMASNNWHVEVTHPAASIFRLYVYDEYSKPFAPRGLAARIVEVPGAGGQPAPAAIAFTPAPGRGYLEARAPALAVPATIAIKVRFETGDKEYRFDFMFPEYSREPPAPGAKPPASRASVV
jgi:hypothetical protein